MYIDVSLKCPDHGEWVAMTRVDADGNTQSAGYLKESDLLNIAPILRTHIAYVEEHGGEGDPLFAAKNLLHHIEVVMGVTA